MRKKYAEIVNEIIPDRVVTAANAKTLASQFEKMWKQTASDAKEYGGDDYPYDTHIDWDALTDWLYEKNQEDMADKVLTELMSRGWQQT